MSKYAKMSVEELLKECKIKKMPVPSRRVAAELISLLDERDEVIEATKDAPNTVDKYPESNFKDISISSFFEHMGSLCIKTDEDCYIETSAVKCICKIHQVSDLKGFPVHVVNISYGYRQGV